MTGLFAVAWTFDSAFITVFLIISCPYAWNWKLRFQNCEHGFILESWCIYSWMNVPYLYVEPSCCLVYHVSLLSMISYDADIWQ
jgi:hypothetical protein